MLKKTQAQRIKANKAARVAEKNGKARDLELFIMKLGIEKLEPETFH